MQLAFFIGEAPARNYSKCVVEPGTAADIGIIVSGLFHPIIIILTL